MLIAFEALAVVAFWASLAYLIWSLHTRRKTTGWILFAGVTGAIGGLTAGYLLDASVTALLGMGAAMGAGAIVLHLAWSAVHGSDAVDVAMTSARGNRIAFFGGLVLVGAVLVLAAALQGWPRLSFVAVAVLLAVRLAVSRRREPRGAQHQNS